VNNKRVPIHMGEIKVTLEQQQQHDDDDDDDDEDE
jgi:hypothetical protein